MLFAANVSAQAKKPRSIISTSATLKGYNTKEQLDVLNKRELLDLYVERLKLIIYTLPNLGLANKPGVTLDDLGIPKSPENDKALDTNINNTDVFLNSTVSFQNLMLPYVDKSDIIISILFYEDVIKKMHTLKDAN